MLLDRRLDHQANDEKSAVVATTTATKFNDEYHLLRPDISDTHLTSTE